MKKTITNLSNKIFLGLCMVVSLLFINCFALLSTLTSSAAASGFAGSSVTVTNGDFTDYTTGQNGLPYKIDTGWSVVGASQSVSYGIIDVKFENFNSTKNNKFGLTSNPLTDTDLVDADNNIVMIKAKSGPTQFGLVSSEITNLKKAKFYQISVHCKTIENATASIYTTLSDTAVDNFININTFGEWKTYNIYIATDAYNAPKFNLELRLGNKANGSDGVVFFDEVEIVEVANIDFNSVTANQQNIKINLDNNYSASNFANNNFESAVDSTWDIEFDSSKSKTGIYSKDSINQFIKNDFNVTTNDDFANDFVYNNNNLLYISNIEKSASKVTSHEENTLIIKQHGFYRLSVYIKTGNISSNGLNITLSDVKESTLATTQSGLTSTSDSLPEYNNFKRIDFFIRGHVWEDKNLSISFELGTSSSNISGWAIIDNISLREISQAEFNTKTSATELDLSKDVQSKQSGLTILNSAFDFVTRTDNTISYPALPLNWTEYSVNQLGGIIRVNSTKFAKDCFNFGLTPAQNPGPNTSYPKLENFDLSADTTKQNVLMVRTDAENLANCFTSDEFSLTASTAAKKYFTRIQVGVKTLEDAQAFIRLTDSNTGAILASIDNITASDWTNYSLFISNGISAQTVRLDLGVKGDANSYAFFDHVTFTADVTDATVQQVLSTPNSTYVDLIEDSFYSHTNVKHPIKQNIYETPNYSLYNFKDDQVESYSIYSGVIDTAVNTTLDTRIGANDSNILAVSNTVATYQQLISNYTYTLIKGSYYEFSVWVKADSIEAGENSKNPGAYFEVATIDKDGYVVVDEKKPNKNVFKGFIPTSEENNGWVKYSIYVLAEGEDNQNVKVIFGLGANDEDSLTKGTVYFDDLKVTDISKDVYTSQKANATTIVSKVVKPDSNSSGDKNNNNSSANTTPSDINFWALSSSIILVVALALAIAGYLIRRIPKKKIEKIEKSAYDKAPTSIDEKEVKRELKVQREQNIEEINNKLKELNETKEKLQKEYEELSNKEESQTIKEKLYTDHTKKINKINKEIDYLSSALTFVGDTNNIKIAETREIKKRKKEAEAEFLRMKNEVVEETEQTEKNNNKKSKK